MDELLHNLHFLPIPMPIQNGSSMKVVTQQLKFSPAELRKMAGYMETAGAKSVTFTRSGAKCRMIIE